MHRAFYAPDAVRILNDAEPATINPPRIAWGGDPWVICRLEVVEACAEKAVAPIIRAVLRAEHLTIRKSSGIPGCISSEMSFLSNRRQPRD